MDDMPRRKSNRLIGLVAIVLVGFIAGFVCGTFVGVFMAGPFGPKGAAGAIRERIFTLCWLAGPVAGALCGYAIFEIASRRKLSKN
jgi:hypothetical protein